MAVLVVLGAAACASAPAPTAPPGQSAGAASADADLVALRPGLTVADAAAAMEALGFSCSRASREMALARGLPVTECTTGAGVVGAIAGRTADDDVRAVEVWVPAPVVAAATAAGTSVDLAKLAGDGVAMLGADPRDGDAISKWIVGRWIEGSSETEDLFGGLRVSLTTSPAGDRTVTVVAAP